MWLVEVRENGKLIDEAMGQNYKTIENSYKKFQQKYPDANVSIEYFS